MPAPARSAAQRINAGPRGGPGRGTEIPWIGAVVRDRAGTTFKLQRWTSIGPRNIQEAICIRTDASPFGMGAILFRNKLPLAWMAEAWSPDDAVLLKASIGNPAWQAEWELIAMLIAVDTWLPQLHSQATGLVQPDATAALHDAARMAGRMPAMNALAAELALRFESAQVRIVP